MSKYVIKNCPYYSEDETLDGYENMTDCQNITDCKLKQIVELCKKTCRLRCTNDCLGTKKHCGYGQILKLLDIQEVE